MKRILYSLLSALLAGCFARAQQSVPEIPFESVPDFFKYPTEMNLGELSAVAVNSEGHIFMISRSNISGPAYGAAATQVFEFDKEGRFVREIGKGLYSFVFGHGLRFDKEDRLWEVDKGGDMVVRFDKNWHVDMTLGRKEENVLEHEYPKRDGSLPQIDGYFREPTDIAWDSKGNIYISDGYVNSRVAKFDPDGFFIKSWGTRGTGPGQFNTPHNIGIDRNDNIYVADRGNGRIQVFDTEGKFLREIKINVPLPPNAKRALLPANGSTTTITHSNGTPWTICITDGPTQYLYTSDSYPGRIYKLTLDGKVVGVLGSGGRKLGQFNWLHGMACPSENELYVADLNNWRVQKLILHPEKMVSSR